MEENDEETKRLMAIKDREARDMKVGGEVVCHIW